MRPSARWSGCSAASGSWRRCGSSWTPPPRGSGRFGPLRSAAAREAPLIHRRQPLDPDLLAHRLRARLELARVDELDRPAGARVAARAPGLVLAQAPLGVGRPAAVERSVGAAQEVDERGHAWRDNRTL